MNLVQRSLQNNIETENKHSQATEEALMDNFDRETFVMAKMRASFVFDKYRESVGCCSTEVFGKKIVI